MAGFVFFGQLMLGASAATASTGCGPSVGRHVRVTTADALQKALNRAQPGDVIQLSAGSYLGHFTLAHGGIAESPIVVCGSGAVLDGGSMASGYTLHLVGAPFVVIQGITIEHGQKAVMVDTSPDVTLRGLTVGWTGYEGVVFRHLSSAGVIRDSTIANTGLVQPEFGEGVYIGSAVNHWTAGLPDQTDRVSVIDNRFGPGITAEAVDIKEGSSGGTVDGNTFDGSGMTAALSWVDVKGNGWNITGNRGTTSLRDGFSDNAAVLGWGNGNVFTRNHADVRGPGYGFRVGANTVGVKIATSNVVMNAASGAANITESNAP